MNFEALFSGELLSAECGRSGHRLIESAQALVHDNFGDEPELLDTEEFLPCLEKCRAAVSEECMAHHVREMLGELGVSGSKVMVDKIRLRAVSPQLEKVEQAAPVFYAHRDTWYGNPRCQINVWLPLHRVDSRNSFRIYLDYFDRPIANDSDRFAAQDFRGFGNLQPVDAQVYPRALELPAGTVYDVKMKEGEVLLFSAAHLHQTLANQTEKVRFSLDFRFYLEEHLKAGCGAPDPDNRSVGLMTEDYRACG